MAKVVVKASAINGTGVFALESLSKGELEYHCDYLAGGKVVLMQFPERHSNHSCDPNMFVKTIHSDFFHLPDELRVEYLPLLDSWYIEEYRDYVQKLLED